MEPILQEWEDFARALGAVTASMDAKGLRDHAKQILRDVAADLETYQSVEDREAKSKGIAPAPSTIAADRGAEMHGDVRATEGFTLDQMLSEYRALRASVLRLWTKMGGIDSASEAEQITRFNEAIDEALALSAKRYTRDVARLIAAAHAKERMAALGTLSAGLGHDMSNVLVPMRVSLDTLEQTALPPESKMILDSLRRSMDHLRGLTRGLRSLTVDPEDSDASPASTQLPAWWSEAIWPYKWAISPEVKLHAEGLDSIDLPAVAVPKHVLMQAVFNLVQNAAESLAAGGGGNIWISAKGSEDGSTVSIEVRDDGPGMDAETLARCTEPFFTTKPRGRGTGLGLSLVRTAIERRKGRLRIESSPNEGCRFTLILPAAEHAGPPLGRRHAIVSVADGRVRAMVAALLSAVDVHVAVAGGPSVSGTASAGSAPREFLWVADASVESDDILRFLEAGGPTARAVILGTRLPMEPGSSAEAAVHDGHLIQIDDPPTHTALQEALRRAVNGWAS